MTIAWSFGVGIGIQPILYHLKTFKKKNILGVGLPTSNSCFFYKQIFEEESFYLKNPSFLGCPFVSFSGVCTMFFFYPSTPIPTPFWLLPIWKWKCSRCSSYWKTGIISALFSPCCLCRVHKIILHQRSRPQLGEKKRRWIRRVLWKTPLFADLESETTPGAPECLSLIGRLAFDVIPEHPKWKAFVWGCLRKQVKQFVKV